MFRRNREQQMNYLSLMLMEQGVVVVKAIQDTKIQFLYVVSAKEKIMCLLTPPANPRFFHPST
jgi:hypothetical protein